MPPADPAAGDPRREVDRLRARLEAVYAELGLERRRSEEPSEQVDRLTRALHQMEMDHLCVEAAASRRLADILSNAATPVQIEPERKAEQKCVHSHVPFQGAKARVFVSRSVRKRSIRSTIAHGRGRQLKTTVDHTLMRGLATAGPCSVSGLPRSRSGRRWPAT